MVWIIQWHDAQAKATRYLTRDASSDEVFQWTADLHKASRFASAEEAIRGLVWVPPVLSPVVVRYNLQIVQSS